MGVSKGFGPLPDDGAGPLYLQLQAVLRKAIDEGALAPGDALPSERDLCEHYGISRITIRRALGGLVGEGRLVRRQGAGTFVSDRRAAPERVEKSFANLSSFSEDMESRGLVPSSEWLSRTRGLVTPDEALALALSPGSPVYRLHRLRRADGRPMAIEHSTIPAYCLPEPALAERSLYVALAAHGYAPDRALQRLRAVNFGPEEAALLAVDEGAAGLLIERRSFLRDGRAVELTRSFYRGDAYDFVAELSTG
ncbi:GntR family transcriptional regulator [Sphingomonas morindae]|uniref:GntR family transcriptional regulator n=1 Tax=Sphingomonas morindae TaxID=1541170 RepID=A0ABY4X792_9SPHN|nr:GntR family transcriptional regulator [Sphingomonas morindae]USI72746.1 GntR family transcriptional regulator [Sphingomonas morindae]